MIRWFVIFKEGDFVSKGIAELPTRVPGHLPDMPCTALAEMHLNLWGHNGSLLLQCGNKASRIPQNHKRKPETREKLSDVHSRYISVWSVLVKGFPLEVFAVVDLLEWNRIITFNNKTRNWVDRQTLSSFQVLFWLESSILVTCNV